MTSSIEFETSPEENLEEANRRIRECIELRNPEIRVTGIGNGQRELLGIIREHFERIHSSFEKLPVTELVPIPGYPQIKVRYEELLAYEVAGDDEYKVVLGIAPKKFSVTKLLDGVDLPGARTSELLAGVFRRRLLRLTTPSLFISYPHADNRFRDELTGALKLYERTRQLQIWDDTCIVPGQKWEDEILAKLTAADIVVLLLSNDFIGSDYCYQKEMEVARERDETGECTIVPIVVRACAYEKLELGQLQAILPNGKSIKENKDRDAAWKEVTKQLDKVISRLNQPEPIQ